MPLSKVRAGVAFFFPAALLFAVIITLTAQQGVAARIAPLAELYFYSATAAALLLGWRFDRSLLVFATVAIALAGWLLAHIGARGDATGRIVSDAVALLLPLNLLALTLLKERGIFTLHGLLRWAMLLCQPPLVWLLLHYRRYDWLGVSDYTLLPLPALDGLTLQQPALLAFAAALLLSGYRALRHGNTLLNALFWALALLGYTLLQGHSPALLTALFASALLLLVVAVLEVSYAMAFRDELTGLNGRRALNQALPKLGGRYTIAMLDVDHFKKFNDSYGHDVGDEVLKMVAAKMSRVSGGGKVFRYGGEEFTVLFPRKGVEQALPHLEQLREAIANATFTVRGKGRPARPPQKGRKGGDKQVQITVSIGVAERQGEERTPEAVIRAADKALYRAKKGGRNRVAS